MLAHVFLDDFADPDNLDLVFAGEPGVTFGGDEEIPGITFIDFVGEAANSSDRLERLVVFSGVMLSSLSTRIFIGVLGEAGPYIVEVRDMAATRRDKSSK